VDVHTRVDKQVGSRGSNRPDRLLLALNRDQRIAFRVVPAGSP
jgi:hypothetical protein